MPDDFWGSQRSITEVDQMRSRAIAIIGLISLVIVFAFVAYVQLLLLCLAGIVCFFLVFGFVRGRGTRHFSIPTARKSDASSPPANAVIKIEGRTLVIDDLPDRLLFTVRRRNLHLIAAIAIIALGAVATCLLVTEPLTQQIDPSSVRYFEFYGLAYFMVVLFFSALVWSSESSLMRSPGITLANIGERESRSGGLLVAYQFTDPRGGYYGGTTMNLTGPKGDHLKVVFCDPKNPDRNKVSCGLLFHKVGWSDKSLT